jgi:hypothetical protein
MSAHRSWMFVAVLAAAAAAGNDARALAGESTKDELAQGDWEGDRTWKRGPAAGVEEPGGLTTTIQGGSSGGGAPATPTPPGTGSGGTATPGGGGTDEEPDSPLDPGTGTGGVAPAPGGAGGTTPPPATETKLLTCTAKWKCEEVVATPELYEKETLLTLVLFRTDAYAFVCNGYCRSESTWYVDLFTTTAANHDDGKSFNVILTIERPCSGCAPRIDLQGISRLDSKAQVKTLWGGVDSSTSASASAGTSWAGDVNCTDHCSASITNSEAGGTAGFGLGPIKASDKSTKSYILVDSPGGKPDSNTVKKARTDLWIENKGGVSTYAAGTEDNAQAKSRAGYTLKIRGESACGPWGEYQVVVK